MSEQQATEFISAVRVLCVKYGAWLERTKEFYQSGGLDRIKIEISLKIT